MCVEIFVQNIKLCNISSLQKWYLAIWIILLRNSFNLDHINCFDFKHFPSAFMKNTLLKNLKKHTQNELLICFFIQSCKRFRSQHNHQCVIFKISFVACCTWNNVVLSLTQTQTKTECSKEANSTPPVVAPAWLQDL